MIKAFLILLIVHSLGRPTNGTSKWSPKVAPLMTRWSKDVTPQNAHQEYPRPQLVRNQWLNLNGLWGYDILPLNQSAPDSFNKQILVPFPFESALSGVMEKVTPDDRMWYDLKLSIPESWAGQRVLLHFEAVDWETNVTLNGVFLGSHKGGYTPFTFDITNYLNQNSVNQELLVSVWDPTSSSFQPRGKQDLNPSGAFYSPTSGIWQTVWLEPVPDTYISNLVIVPDVDSSSIVIQVDVIGNADVSAHIVVYDPDNGNNVINEGTAKPSESIKIVIPYAKLWSPSHPVLYPFTVTLSGSNGDSVKSYFGMKKVSLGKDNNGVIRALLNDDSLFLVGPLDQGFWPDGIYTAPTEEAMKNDILTMKSYGFNMVRKHVKVEPSTWYYWCDVLGLVVWQDMPSGDKGIGPNDPDLVRTPESAANYFREWTEIMDKLSNHPSVSCWITFNEGWGQFNTSGVLNFTREKDPTRLVDSTTGGIDRFVGDFIDLHIYPEPEPGANSLLKRGQRAVSLGETGGLGLHVVDHVWMNNTWAYQLFNSSKELTDAFVNHTERLSQLILPPVGYSAAVYTQLTDCEGEINGFMTYDRDIYKIDVSRASKAIRALYDHASLWKRNTEHVRKIIPNDKYP